MNRCLVVTGMHRSGTSLLASFLQAAGVEVGTDLFPADYYNPRGYFEDNEFLELDTAILHSCFPPGASGFRDWGWSEDEPLDRSRVADFTDRGADLVARRAQGHEFWGWKDPRTSLLLDFWDGLLPDARYLFTYRSPWDVMGSVARLAGTFFEARPDRGLGPWLLYNRQLLDFYRRHRERCLLLPIEALSSSPDALLALVADKLGLRLPRIADGPELLARVAEPALLSRIEARPGLAGVLARVFPEETTLWSELEDAADLKAGRPAMVAVAEEAAGRLRPTAKAISVVIRCCDEDEQLLASLASVEAVHPPCEPILVDDRSTRPYSLLLLARLLASGTPVVRSEQAGSSALRNAGIAAASAAVVLTLDRPALLRPEFLAEAADLFAREPRLGALCGDPVVGYDDLGSSGPLPGLAEVIAGGSGDCAAPVLRRQAWEECRGYDEELAGGYENWDMLLSLSALEWRVARPSQAICERRSTSRPGPAPLSIAQQRQWLERVTGRHPLLVDARLPGLLAQLEIQLLERAEVDFQTESEAHARTGERLTAAHGEIDRLVGERQGLAAELERWQARVAFMEGTAAWRLRARLLALRRRSRPGDSQ